MKINRPPVMDSPSTMSNSVFSGARSDSRVALDRNHHGELAISKHSGPAKILLVSNQVMHYRVPVYNYFHSRFREYGFEFSVLTDCLQKQNQKALAFELR